MLAKKGTGGIISSVMDLLDSPVEFGCVYGSSTYQFFKVINILYTAYFGPVN